MGGDLNDRKGYLSWWRSISQPCYRATDRRCRRSNRIEPPQLDLEVDQDEDIYN
jgi:hypothetical protein